MSIKRPSQRFTRSKRPAFDSRMLESLEQRCLLSASVAEAALTAQATASADSQVDMSAAQPAVSYFGKMKFRQIAGQAARPPLEVSVTMQPTLAGDLSGVITVAGKEDIEFTGQLETGKNFSLQFEGDTEGYVAGKIKKDGIKLNGTMYNISEGSKSKLKLAAADVSGRTIGAISSIATATPGQAAINNQVGNPPPEFLSSEGELRFTDTYTGTTTLRFAPEIKEHYGQPSANFGPPTTYNVTLNITSENSADLLQGTMTISSLGTYNVVGVVKWSDMTLIVTPQTGSTGAAGTGVAKLKIARNGLTYSGEFRQESNDTWGFGSMTLTRPVNGTGTVPPVVSPPVVSPPVVSPPTVPPTVPPVTGVPAAPTNLVITGTTNGNVLTWTASTSPSVIGYNVYRAVVSNGAYVKLNTTLINGVTYTDAGAVQGAAHFYRVAAVNTSLTESGFATGSAVRPIGAGTVSPPVTSPTVPPVTSPTVPPVTSPTVPPVTSPTVPPVTSPTVPPVTSPTVPPVTSPPVTTPTTGNSGPVGNTPGVDVAGPPITPGSDSTGTGAGTGTASTSTGTSTTIVADSSTDAGMPALTIVG